MPDKRSKYDTDPLDPDFLRRTEEVSGLTRDVSREAPPTDQPRRGADDTPADEPTRRFEEQFTASYPSVFVPPEYQPPARPPQGYTTFGNEPPAAPGPAPLYDAHARPSSRPVEKLGIGENVATILPYAPFYVGLVASIVELLVVPRAETRTRFHAAQGLALQLAITAGSILFSVVGSVTDSSFGGFIFWLASFIFQIVSMMRVWQGKPHHIAPLDDATRWLGERLEPRK